MEVPLIVSATLLGLAGAPHCAAMCSAPCAAATGRQPRHSLVFHLARVGSYALGGAVVASSVAALALCVAASAPPMAMTISPLGGPAAA